MFGRCRLGRDGMAPYQALTKLMGGRTKGGSVLFVVGVPRIENDCDGRAVIFDPRIRCRRVHFVNDLMALVWGIPTQSGAQEPGCCSGEGLLISEVS